MEGFVFIFDSVHFEHFHLTPHPGLMHLATSLENTLITSVQELPLSTSLVYISAFTSPLTCHHELCS